MALSLHQTCLASEAPKIVLDLIQSYLDFSCWSDRITQINQEYHEEDYHFSVCRAWPLGAVLSKTSMINYRTLDLPHDHHFVDLTKGIPLPDHYYYTYTRTSLNKLFGTPGILNPTEIIGKEKDIYRQAQQTFSRQYDPDRTLPSDQWIRV